MSHAQTSGPRTRARAFDVCKLKGASWQRGAGQTLDMKSNLCPNSVQCLSKPCPTSVQVQGLSCPCPGQVHSLSWIGLRPVHLQTSWTGIGHTGPVFVLLLSSRGSNNFISHFGQTLDKHCMTTDPIFCQFLVGQTWDITWTWTNSGWAVGHEPCPKFVQTLSLTKLSTSHREVVWLDRGHQ